MKTSYFAIAAMTSALAVVGCTALSPLAVAEETAATRQLVQRNDQLRRDLVQVSPSVYTAVSYSPANISMIVGQTGIIIVDTGMSPAHAAAALADFRNISTLPVTAIIYTHGHGDHTGGGQVFANGADPQVWARANFGSEGSAFASAGLTIQGVRGARQGGFRLRPEQRINNGIALAFSPPAETGEGEVFAGNQPLVPTDTFTGIRKSLNIAGVDIDLVAAPGETDDGLYVWLPEEKVLFSGDSFYASWPNAYAIRGTPYRDVHAWGNSTDAMLKEGAIAVVPGHTRPILGKSRVAQVLTDYRDAIQYVFDKTIEGMNKGMTPDQLVEYVELPPELSQKDYLKEFYGNVDWAVRSIFTGYLGWFDGNATTLFPLSPTQEAMRVAELAGGKDALLSNAQKALRQGDAQWAAELVDHLITLDPDNAVALQLKAEALTELASDLISATGRNYYLTSALELRQRAAALHND